MPLTTSRLSFWAIRHHKMSLPCFIDTIVSCPCLKKSLEVYYHGVNRKGFCVCVDQKDAPLLKQEQPDCRNPPAAEGSWGQGPSSSHSFILHTLTATSLCLHCCSLKHSEKKTLALLLLSLCLHQTDKWSGQRGDRGLFRNDKYLNDGLGGHIFVWW